MNPNETTAYIPTFDAPLPDLQGLRGWHPIVDQVLVKPLTVSNRTAGGLHTPEAHRERPHSGLVIAVGDGDPSRATPMAVAPGELVAFGKHAGMDFTLNDEPFYLLRDLECLARKRAECFELTLHTNADGKLIALHESHEVCDDCPGEKEAAARMQKMREDAAAQRKADLQTLAGEPDESPEPGPPRVVLP